MAALGWLVLAGTFLISGKVTLQGKLANLLTRITIKISSLEGEYTKSTAVHCHISQPLRRNKHLQSCGEHCHPYNHKVMAATAALRLVMLDIPSPTTLGESVELTCSYELDNDQLYSVKWYKNDVEFYRYVPNDWPPGQYLPLPGVRVDLSKSGRQSVYLRHVDLNTAGIYRCEVSAEAPSFQTAEAEKEMQVFVLPTDGPKITGGQTRYHIGDTVAVNCTSAKSKPAATLRWYINEEVAGSEYEAEYSTTLHADGLETSSLGLRFVVTDRHFRHGNMKLKCTATISRVYTMSNEELVFGGRRQTSGLHVSENLRVRNTAAIVATPVRWTKMLVASLVLLAFHPCPMLLS